MSDAGRQAGEDIMSAFVWLDYSERERSKMLDVVEQWLHYGAGYAPARFR
jgi:hypothetical protein